MLSTTCSELSKCDPQERGRHVGLLLTLPSAFATLSDLRLDQSEARSASAMLPGPPLNQGQCSDCQSNPRAHVPRVPCLGSSLLSSLVSAVPLVVNPHQRCPRKTPRRNSSMSPLRNNCRSTARFSRIPVRTSMPKPRMPCLSVSLRALDCPLRVAVATPVPAPDQEITRRGLASCPLAHP